MVVKLTIFFLLLATGAAVAQAPPSTPSCPVELAKIARIVPAASPQVKDKACRVSTPVKVLAIRTKDGDVALSGEPLLDCPFALELARWTRTSAAPTARKRLRRRLVGLDTGPGFQCRRRNRRRTGKLSEHSFGNAVDITAFRFAAKGRRARFVVAPARKMRRRERNYLAAVRKASCGYFTTILGPGSNAAHADHLHFDLGRAWRNGKRRENPYRICD